MTPSEAELTATPTTAELTAALVAEELVAAPTKHWSWLGLKAAE